MVAACENVGGEMQRLPPGKTWHASRTLYGPDGAMRGGPAPMIYVLELTQFGLCWPTQKWGADGCPGSLTTVGNSSPGTSSPLASS